MTPPPGMAQDITAQNAPFKCPHCGEWANSIDTVVNGRMLIMFHSGEGACLKVLSVQLISVPTTQPPSRIILPQ